MTLTAVLITPPPLLPHQLWGKHGATCTRNIEPQAPFTLAIGTGDMLKGEWDPEDWE